MKQIVLATRNQDKITEIRRIMQLDSIRLVGIDIFPQAPDVVEDGKTLHDNALKKACSACISTGLPAIADDSGLEVDALDGAPGVYSSRFAGEHVSYADNNAKLLYLMRNVPQEKRTARFRCVTCFVDGDEHHFVEAVCEGMIIQEIRGDGGFGYDPLFLVPYLGKTFAELTLEEKNEISHRGKAFRGMGDLIRKYYSEDRR